MTTTTVRPLRADAARLLREEPAQFTRTWGLQVAEEYLAFPETLDRLVRDLEAGGPPEWHSHLIVDPSIATVVGLGGYKGPPRDGVVQIGYSVAPAHRGRGHATNAVTVWARRAAAAGATRVVAHTLTGSSPSTRVLERCGFVQSGPHLDEIVGRVWTWTLELDQ